MHRSSRTSPLIQSQLHKEQQQQQQKRHPDEKTTTGEDEDATVELLSTTKNNNKHVPTVTTTTVTSPSDFFKSPVMHVWIEDTDAYAIVYNANYLRFYERALHYYYCGNNHNNHETKAEWPIVKVDQHKFRKSPALGEGFVITGQRRRRHIASSMHRREQSTLSNDDEEEETWELQMKSPCGTIEFNSALITIATELPKNIPPLEQESFTAKSTNRWMYKDVLYRDEFDVHLLNRIPIRNVLNPLERARSNALGGPDSLRQLQHSNHLVFVVTSIDQMTLLHNPLAICCPGTQITITTTIQLLRRGMCRFLQTMWVETKHNHLNGNKINGKQNDNETNLQRVAQAVVMVMALDASTRKPRFDIPEWLSEQLVNGTTTITTTMPTTISTSSTNT